MEFQTQINIGDALFERWRREQPDDTQIDLEAFWRREVLKHPFIRSHPDTAPDLRKHMLLTYARERHDYDPRTAAQDLAESLT